MNSHIDDHIACSIPHFPTSCTVTVIVHLCRNHRRVVAHDVVAELVQALYRRSSHSLILIREAIRDLRSPPFVGRITPNISYYY